MSDTPERRELADRSTEDVESVLTELQAFCAKWDVEIGGCGCCGSPWLRVATYTYIDDVFVTATEGMAGDDGEGGARYRVGDHE